MNKLSTGLVVLAALLVTVFGLYSSGTIPYKAYIVHTGSMGASIPSRSAVFVHEGQYHVGQVVSFALHGETVTHRLLGIRSDGTITTKGDANSSADPWHPAKSAIIGGVVVAPRGLGWVMQYVLHTPTGALSIFLFFLCFWWSFRLGDNPSNRKSVSIAM